MSFFVLTSFSLFAQEEYGLASYYGDEFNGRKTAYGEIYDKTKLTAAHKKYPKGTMLKVTKIDNNKSVTVRVNDKGPFVKGRIIDLSRAAAEKIGLVKAGLAEVKVEVLGKKSSVSTTTVPKSTPKVAIQPAVTVKKEVKDTPIEYADAPKVQPKEKSTTSQAKKKAEKAKITAKKKPLITVGESKKAAVAKKPAPKPSVKPIGIPTKGVYQIVKKEAAPTGYTVQVASSGSHNLMEEEVAKLKAKWFKTFVLSVEEDNGKAKFNVGLGTFEKATAANNYKKNLKKRYKIDGFISPLSMDDATPKGNVEAKSTKLNLAHVGTEKYGVQVASLNNFKSYLKEFNKLEQKGFSNILIGIKKDGTFKAILGPFETQDAAKTYQKNLAKKYKIKGFVLNLDGVQ